MLAKSHMSLGLLGGIGLGYLAAPVFGDAYFSVLLPLIIVGSVFPDIDEPKSFIGRKLPLLSRVVSLSFSHRGFTHFLIFPLIIAVCGAVLLTYNNIVALCCFAFAFGIFMHQLGDMMTISGIPHYFFPFAKTKAVILPKMLRFRTGSATEKCVLYGVFVPLIALCGMEKFNLLSGFDFESMLKMIGDFT